MRSERKKKTDLLWDKLAAKHFTAQREAGNNPDATSVKAMKFQKGTAEDVKKLAIYYKFEQFKPVVGKAYTYIDRAYELYTSYEFEGSPQRMLEALIAGGCNNRKAAEACGLDERTVAAYKNYYFNLEDWSTKQLKIKCQMMLPVMGREDECRWGWILSTIINGEDWFIRTYIELDPTDEDDKLSEKFRLMMYNRVRNASATTLVNMDNVTEQYERQANIAGATHSHMQKDKELAHRLSRTGASEESMDDYIDKMYEAMESEGVMPQDVKESAYTKGLPAEEDIIIEPLGNKKDNNNGKDAKVRTEKNVEGA